MSPTSTPRAQVGQVEHGGPETLPIHSYPELLTDPATTWSYRGEGNANIVFAGRIVSSSIRAHLGTSHLTLRVAKRAHPSHGSPSSPGSQTDPATPVANGDQKAEHGSSADGQFALGTVRFITQVINPLFPDRYLPKMIAVRVTPAFLLALDAASSDARPTSRSAKGAIDTAQTVALLSPDYARMDLGHGSDQVETMCFEIKPKWLFIPRRHRPQATHAQDAASRKCSRPNRTPTPATGLSASPSPSPSPPLPSACRFCAHQRYKFATDPNHAQLSAFCPLDLLSRTTIQDAVRSLLDTPNNNLRVWMNGQRTKAPTANAPVFENTPGRGGVALERVLVEVLSQLVPLFTTLGEHQSSLDDVGDVQQVHDAYLRVCAQHADPVEGLSLETWATAVRTYLGRRGADNPAEQDELDALQLVAEFVLSMTLKDCSVLVTVAPWQPTVDLGEGARYARASPSVVSLPDELVDQGLALVSFGCGSWVYRATLLDLDPKQMNKVPLWLKLDQDIRGHYATYELAG